MGAIIGPLSKRGKKVERNARKLQDPDLDEKTLDFLNEYSPFRNPGRWLPKPACIIIASNGKAFVRDRTGKPRRIKSEDVEMEAS